MTIGTQPSAGLAERATTYARTRSPEDLALLRDLVRSSPGFDPGLDVTGLVAPLLERGDHVACREAVRARMPGAFLSPSAHAALAACHDAAGDDAAAWRERRTARLALESVLSTGDGTRDRPWSVLRVNDEYDVLRHLRRRSRGQRLVSAGEGRSFDVHRCDDGTEAWFDVTDLVRR